MFFSTSKPTIKGPENCCLSVRLMKPKLMSTGFMVELVCGGSRQRATSSAVRFTGRFFEKPDINARNRMSCAFFECRRPRATRNRVRRKSYRSFGTGLVAGLRAARSRECPACWRSGQFLENRSPPPGPLESIICSSRGGEIRRFSGSVMSLSVIVIRRRRVNQWIQGNVIKKR